MMIDGIDQEIRLSITFWTLSYFPYYSYYDPLNSLNTTLILLFNMISHALASIFMIYRFH